MWRTNPNLNSLTPEDLAEKISDVKFKNLRPPEQAAALRLAREVAAYLPFPLNRGLLILADIPGEPPPQKVGRGKSMLIRKLKAAQLRKRQSNAQALNETND